MAGTALLLGVDGGGTGCRARLAGLDGQILGEGSAGPANIRFGLDESFASVLSATEQCLDQVGLSLLDANIVACLALAGASEPNHLAAARAFPLPFYHTVFTTDAQAACVGAHGGDGGNGGIIIVGTGSVGWALAAGREHRVGGWGFPVSDEGSGAWLGSEAVRRTFWAYDGRLAWSDLLKEILLRFEGDPHAIVRWTGEARPRDFATLAPLVVKHAERQDPVACNLMREAAHHIDAIATRMTAQGVARLALSGGLGQHIEPWLSQATRGQLVAPLGDTLSGALILAQQEAWALALPRTAAGGA